MKIYGQPTTAYTTTCRACNQQWNWIGDGLAPEDAVRNGSAGEQQKTCIHCASVNTTTIVTTRPDGERHEPMHLLLGVTGSVAAGVIPKLTLRIAKGTGATIDIVATKASRHFWDPEVFNRESQFRGWTYRVWDNRDEWPEGGYTRGAKIAHIELREWADVLVIAPLSANTLAKLAHGFADGILTNIVRAWRRDRPIVIAPAMNTQMWEHPATQEHLATLVRWFPKLIIMDPQVKTLACGTTGKGAMANIEDILSIIASLQEDGRRPPEAVIDDWHAHIRQQAAAIDGDAEWFAEHGGC